MGFSKEKKHIIDLIFPIGLFFVFAASSFALVILAANIYSSTVHKSQSSFGTRTVLSYITEKIRQSDQNDAVSLGTFDGQKALVLKQTYDNDITYTTYIYEYRGTLRELFIQDGVKASAGNGREITQVQDFSIEELDRRLFQFTCTSMEGDTLSIVVSAKSEKEKEENYE